MTDLARRLRGARGRGLALGMGIALLALSSCGSCGEGFDKGFKASFERSFAESCTKSGVSSGGQEAVVRPLCACAGKYLTAHHDAGELTKMSTGMNAEESGKIIRGALEACRSTAKP